MTTPLTERERRVDPRVDLLAQIQVSRKDEVHIMSTLNISRGGAFVQGNPSDVPELKIGTEVELVIFATDDIGHDVSCTAKVVRIERGHLPGRTPGFGLQFMGIKEEAKQLLDRFMGGMGGKLG